MQPQLTETYTFTTLTDDGVRLWLGGKQLVNKWVDQGPTEWSGTVALVAGKMYEIKMEYYEKGGGAVAKLLWSSPSLPGKVIPRVQLYTTLAAPNRSPVAVSLAVESTPQNTPVPITLAATDPDNDPLTYVITTPPAHGTLTGTMPNLTYTPSPGYLGSDSFSFKANYGKADSNVATVGFHIAPRPGDVNADGRINVADAVLVLQAIVELSAEIGGTGAEGGPDAGRGVGRQSQRVGRGGDPPPGCRGGVTVWVDGCVGVTP